MKTVNTILVNFPQIIGIIKAENTQIDCLKEIIDIRSLMHKFVTLTSSGITKEGDEVKEYFSSTEVAEDKYNEELLTFLQNTIDKEKMYLLLWRKEPSIQMDTIKIKNDYKKGDISLLTEECMNISFFYVLSRIHLYKLASNN
jgi:hypothetical protein